MIFQSSLIEATNTDVLAGTRLNSIPYAGRLTFLFLADLGNAANNYVLTLQLPNGDVPIDAQRVWASSSGSDMVMDEREYMRFTFDAAPGGHFVVSLTETGTAVCTVVARLN